MFIGEGLKKKREVKKLSLFCIYTFLFLQTSCSSFQKVSNSVNHYLKTGDYEKACEVLKPHAEKDSDDQLVYLLDYGMCLHLAAKYNESIKVLLKADAIAEVKDYTSLSRQTLSIFLNEGMVQYRGDDFEKIFIHVYLALNFLMKNDLEAGLVEARRVNEILVKYRDEGKRDYDQNHFAIYLSAIMWEAEKYYDDAYIAYKNANKFLKNSELIKKDLLRSSKLAQRPDEFAKWQKQFPNTQFEMPSKNQGELIVIFQQGLGPRKVPDPAFTSLPTLVSQPSVVQKIQLEVAGKKILSEDLYSVDEVAKNTLKEQYASLLAKRVAGKVTKYGIAHQVSKENEVLGLLTWVGLNLVDQADLRQWSNLPASFQVARVYLPQGTYKVHINHLNGANVSIGEKKEFDSVQVKAGKKTFLTLRSF